MNPEKQGKHSGDNGKTSFLGKGTIWKNSARIKALGSLDEAISTLGLIRAFNHEQIVNEICSTLQSGLAMLSTEIATDKKKSWLHPKISQKELNWLEEKNNELEQDLDKEAGFLIPGKTIVSAFIDFARVTIRRAERECTLLHRKSLVNNPVLVSWLNRASTLLYSLEKWEIKRSSSHK